MKTATELLQEQVGRDRDERSLHSRMLWFTEKWADEMNLSREQVATFSADLVMVVQAVHRDASRDTHALLTKALAAMPAPVFVTKKE